MNTETIDKLFLELSQFTSATTAKELMERSVADSLTRTFELIDYLRSAEGSSVEICSDNTEFNGQPTCLVITHAVGDRSQRWQGETILECLQKAANAAKETK